MVSKKQKSQMKTIRKLQSWIDTNKPSKPDVHDIGAELGSLCIKYVPKKTAMFDGYVIMSSIGKEYGKIIIPVKMTTHSNSLNTKGDMMTSFLVFKDKVCFRYKLTPVKSASTQVVGADVGQTTVLSLSDGIATTKCPHGHDLKSINAKMAQKKIGSKAFARAKAHSINYIGWSLNQIDFSQYNIVRLESNKHIKRGRSTSRSLKYWSWSAIYKSIASKCEEAGVRLELQQSAYKSQRCYACGYVHKQNRKGKLFRCRCCGYTDDADMNGAKNNSINLCVISREFMGQGYNRSGFYWELTGCYLDKERTVPCIKKE